MQPVTCIIPCRFDSSRFPGKVLADATGKPMIQHVWERVRSMTFIERIIIATDDERICSAVESFGGEYAMTRCDHPNGTSRLAEVAATLNDPIILNVQGDEPEIESHVVKAALKALDDDPDSRVSTVASPFADGEDAADPNIVKVVVDTRGRAMYFSRSLIPYPRSDPQALPLKHVGLYVYRRDFLLHFVEMPPTPLEQTEQLEQLRMLESGEHIAVGIATTQHHGIDTPEQYKAFCRRYERAASTSASS